MSVVIWRKSISNSCCICCGGAKAGWPNDRPVNKCKLFADGTFHASTWWSTLHGCYDRKYSDRSSRLHTYSMRGLVGLLKGRLWNPYSSMRCSVIPHLRNLPNLQTRVAKSDLVHRHQWYSGWFISITWISFRNILQRPLTFLCENFSHY